jgi:hypothetical protein
MSVRECNRHGVLATRWYTSPQRATPGSSRAKVLDIEPLRRLRLSCRWLFAPELAADKPHRETFELEALGNITRLTATFDEYEEGSASYYACDMARTGDSLKTLLESGSRLFAPNAENVGKPIQTEAR